MSRKGNPANKAMDAPRAPSQDDRAKLDDLVRDKAGTGYTDRERMIEKNRKDGGGVQSGCLARPCNLTN